MQINFTITASFYCEMLKYKRKWCCEVILILESRMCCMHPLQSAVKTLLL